MASWDETSSYQGAASGAAIGAVGGVPGALIGAGVGFVAGGLLGGAAADAARAAEEKRRKEIERAIDRQKQETYSAIRSAEQMALADIGLSDEQAYQQLGQDMQGYQSSAESSQQAYQGTLDKIDKLQSENEGILEGIDSLDREGRGLMHMSEYDRANFRVRSNEAQIKKLQDKIPMQKYYADVSSNRLNVAEGILSAYENNNNRPLNY